MCKNTLWVHGYLLSVCAHVWPQVWAGRLQPCGWALLQELQPLRTSMGWAAAWRAHTEPTAVLQGWKGPTRPGAPPPPVPISQREAAVDHWLRPEGGISRGKWWGSSGCILHLSSSRCFGWFPPHAALPPAPYRRVCAVTVSQITGCDLRVQRWVRRLLQFPKKMGTEGNKAAGEAQSAWVRCLPATLMLHLLHPIRRTCLCSCATRTQLYTRSRKPRK